MSLPLPIAHTSVEIAAAHLAELDRTEAARRRRHLVRLIDLAIGQCEAANLAAAGPGPASINDRPAAPVPAAAAALVVWLLVAAGRPAIRPATAVEALEDLLELQRPYLRRSDRLQELDDDEDDDLVGSAAR